MRRSLPREVLGVTPSQVLRRDLPLTHLHWKSDYADDADRGGSYQSRCCHLPEIGNGVEMEAKSEHLLDMTVICLTKAFTTRVH